MPKAPYQIVHSWPVYCEITDGLIGSSSCRLPMTYYSKSLAWALAGRIARKCWDEGGDDSYFVIDTRTGRRIPFETPPQFEVERDDFIPF